MITLTPTPITAAIATERCYCVPNGKHRWFYVWATSATEARAIATLKALTTR